MSDDERPQATELKKLLAKIPVPDFPKFGISEILYTAAENNLLGDLDSLDEATAFKIWKLVELSRTITPEQVRAIRM